MSASSNRPDWKGVLSVFLISCIEKDSRLLEGGWSIESRQIMHENSEHVVSFNNQLKIDYFPVKKGNKKRKFQTALKSGKSQINYLKGWYHIAMNSLIRAKAQ